MDSQPDLFESSELPESTDAFGDLGYRSAAEVDASLAKSHDRAVPKDEAGRYLTDEIKPGHFLPGWGPVTGRPLRPNDRKRDNIVDYPAMVPIQSRSLLAAVRYADLINRGDEVGAINWKAFAESQGWIKHRRASA